jgi:hypothetical protein
MRKAVAFALTGLALASAVAYAQHGSGSAPANHGGMMHDRTDMQNLQIKG